jgi:hypothetical protein
MCHMVRTLLEICTALNGNPGEMRWAWQLFFF